MSGAPVPRVEHGIQLSPAVNVSSESVVTNTAPLPAVHAVSSSDGVRHSKNAGRELLHPACVDATASIVMRVSSTREVRAAGACGGRNGWHRVGASSTHAVEAHSFLRDGERLLSREYHTVVMGGKCRRSGMPQLVLWLRQISSKRVCAASVPSCTVFLSIQPIVQ